jgi:hypothetical protein
MTPTAIPTKKIGKRKEKYGMVEDYFFKNYT